MHGLVLRTIQVFITDTYGPQAWKDTAALAELDSADIEAMLQYPPDIPERLLSAAYAVLAKPGDALLEDVGTYLVTHPNSQALRRLLRFGGTDFIEFLHSLDDLPDRARLAVADLVLPDLELLDHDNGSFDLRIGASLPGFGAVMLGVLRAIADDYGSLALLDHSRLAQGEEMIHITVVDTSYAEGREFDLSAKVPG
ncbi:heme NO-binding domain-containing protein [Thalassococcus lentus]|uniref:Heme NO-binding domain-containing protein n=1 Tax=Thalassococcus lentus TaxID=1210524 RepID=A0ABT4XWQ4_9RHOB|nr:heme NO-binding domain-containing protein [Thalassococcus lentus]MDA7426392.1 heme NO-binding domain-containing protein [Thalassococcus lentus]